MGSGRKRPPPPVVEEEGHDSDGGSMKKRKFLPTSIRNKEKRAAVHAELKREKVEKKKKAKLRDAADKKALELSEAPPPRKVPRTIENTREADETVCTPDDAEVFAGNDADEFNSILKKERTPKVLITTCRFNSTRGPAFISELLLVIPNAHYFKRGTNELKKLGRLWSMQTTKTLRRLL